MRPAPEELRWRGCGGDGVGRQERGGQALLDWGSSREGGHGHPGGGVLSSGSRGWKEGKDQVPHRPAPQTHRRARSVTSRVSRAASRRMTAQGNEVARTGTTGERAPLEARLRGRRGSGRGAAVVVTGV